MTLLNGATSRTRIKLCGFTRKEDVAAAVALGVDALGFVFYPKSKRFVTPELAHELAKEIPAFVSAVALFVDPDVGFVREVMDALRPAQLQMHGDETAAFCESLNWPYVKAFRVGAPGMDSESTLHASCWQYSGASAWLYDSYTPAYGGSGHGFDRALLKSVLQDPQSRPVVLSGGLTPDNVQPQVMQLRPWAVDVSSGIEDAPGVKSIDKMAAFVEAVRRADQG